MFVPTYSTLYELFLFLGNRKPTLAYTKIFFPKIDWNIFLEVENWPHLPQVVVIHPSFLHHSLYQSSFCYWITDSLYPQLGLIHPRDALLPISGVTAITNFFSVCLQAWYSSPGIFFRIRSWVQKSLAKSTFLIKQVKQAKDLVGQFAQISGKLIREILINLLKITKGWFILKCQH